MSKTQQPAHAAGATFSVEPNIQPRGPGTYGDAACRQSPNEALKAAWATTTGGSVEKMSDAPPGTVAVFTKRNLFAEAVHAAFFEHHPLILSPDLIWTTIAQGLANHVDQNAEALRSRLVPHEGKVKIVVTRPDFVKGDPGNDWENVFPEFESKIKELSLPGIAELVACDFSTTGPAERIASQITLMDTVQHFFNYEMRCGCGFPSITLTGCSEDWSRLRAKAEELRRFDLDWWLDSLLPALDQFVLASKGQPDLRFWRSLCMINTGTSFPVFEPLSGWVQVFFPYLISPGISGFGGHFDKAEDGKAKKALQRNENLGAFAASMKSGVGPASWDALKQKARQQRGTRIYSGEKPEGVGVGVKLELFPPAVASAPFIYVDDSTGTKYRMAFLAGVTALVQHPTYGGALEPRIGWAVVEGPSAAGSIP